MHMGVVQIRQNWLYTTDKVDMTHTDKVELTVNVMYDSKLDVLALNHTKWGNFKGRNQ